MNRIELQDHVCDTIRDGKDWIYLTMNGDPGSARQRLLGHHWGPKGWVCGHRSPDNIVRFNAQYVQEYLDELPMDKLPWDEDVLCEVATPELLDGYCSYRGLMYGEDQSGIT